MLSTSPDLLGVKRGKHKVNGEQCVSVPSEVQLCYNHFELDAFFILSVLVQLLLCVKYVKMLCRFWINKM